MADASAQLLLVNDDAVEIGPEDSVVVIRADGGFEGYLAKTDHPDDLMLASAEQAGVLLLLLAQPGQYERVRDELIPPDPDEAN